MRKLAIGCLGLLTASLGGCGDGKAGKGEIVLHGNVDLRQVSLAFDGNGRIVRMNAEEGDQVRAGTVLAELDTVTLQLQAQQAKAQLDQQQQNLRKLLNGSRPEEIAESRAKLADAQAQAARAQDDLKRMRDIAGRTDGRGVSGQDLDRAARDATAAQARADEQAQALRLARIGPREEEIAGARAQVASAQAQLALLQHQIDQGHLVAPSDGVVRSRLLQPGDQATPQKPVFNLALTHPKWVRVYVPEPDLGRIRMGLPAKVTTDSMPGQYVSGRIGYISSVSEFTPKSVETEDLRTSLVYEVRVWVDDPGNRLRLGQPVTATLETGSSR